MKKYFISYSHMNENGEGFGCCTLLRKKKIKSIEDINEIKNSIENQVKDKPYPIKNVVILNFKRLW